MDEYFEQYYFQIEKEYNEHFDNLEKQFSGMDEYHAWGGGRFNSPPF